MRAQSPTAPEKTLQEFHASMGAPISECIEKIARRWFGYSAGESPLGEGVLPNTENTPNVLKALAEKYGVALEFTHRRAIRLLPMRYPCIYVLNDGSGVIATGSNRESVTLWTGQETILVTSDSIERETETLVITPSSSPDEGKFHETFDEANSTKVSSRASLVWLTKEILQDHRSTVSLMFIATLISNMLMIALPLFIMSVYDRVIPHGALETLWALSFGVLIALGVDLGIRHVKLKLADSAALSTSVKIQTHLMRVMTDSKLESVPKSTAAWSATFRDIDNASSLVPAMMSAVLIDVPFVVLVLVLIYSIAGTTVMAPILGITLFAIWTFFAQHRLSKVGEREALLQNAKIEILDETANNIKTIKTTNNQSARLSVFERLLDVSIPSSHGVRQQTGMQSQTTMVMVQVVIVMSIILGVYQISSGNMTVGALAATTLLVGRVLLPAGNVLMLLARYGQISKALNRVHDLLHLPQERMMDSREQRPIKDAHLELKNVNFGFENSAVQTLSGISLSISPGEKVAIIGKSGSGKSTLMQLLCKLYEPTSGTFLIDQFDSRQFSHFEIRKNLSYMPQDSELFDASIYDNLKVGNPEANHDRILDALAISGAAEFIRSVPDGLSFEVGRKGERLSGGERQSLALARTILSSGKVLLLDEPTSSMDNTTENGVIAGIKDYAAGKTLIITTHRANILSIVDRIIWMDKGKIIADGPRNEVLSRLQKAA